jgi:hypothetical protein
VRHAQPLQPCHVAVFAMPLKLVSSRSAMSLAKGSCRGADARCAVRLSGGDTRLKMERVRGMLSGHVAMQRSRSTYQVAAGKAPTRIGNPQEIAIV